MLFVACFPNSVRPHFVAQRCEPGEMTVNQVLCDTRAIKIVLAEQRPTAAQTRYCRPNLLCVCRPVVGCVFLKPTINAVAVPSSATMGHGMLIHLSPAN